MACKKCQLCIFLTFPIEMCKFFVCQTPVKQNKTKQNQQQQENLCNGLYHRFINLEKMDIVLVGKTNQVWHCLSEAYSSQLEYAYWIGLHDGVKEGSFVWLDETEEVMLPWTVFSSPNSI